MSNQPGKAFLFAKRAIDIAGASLAVVVLLPLTALVCVVVKLGSKGPVLFRQGRLGKGGVPFTLYKFRTMRDGAPMVRNADGSAFVGAGDPRLTRAGKFLRDSTLDEIPQLINVLKGDMSLVGPRPDLVEQLELYDGLMRRKLEVRPGMASLSLVHGRNSLAWYRRAELDVYYVDHRSLLLDAKIFLMAFLLVLLRRGVYYPKDYGGNSETGPEIFRRHT
ncbi:MAG TPA: sugar transferase [Pyrinomonadaceae bacterium]|nr:sugar transferase [Pyrinomonadaceae bacterium]